MHIYETEYFNVTILFHMLAYGFSGYHNYCGNHSVHACLCSQTVYRIDCFTLGLASSSYALQTITSNSLNILILYYLAGHLRKIVRNNL